MLIAVRLFGGAMQANAAVANAYVADITPPEGRAKRFGMLGAMFGMGFILGPVMGGLLGDINIHLPFFVAGCLGGAERAVRLLCAAANRCRLRAVAPFEWKRCQSFPVDALAGLAKRHGGPLVGVIACAAWRSSCCTTPGCSTPPSSSAGATQTTAGPCLPWV
jgi:DHA1 family tetracycline resistance protein-like MFS transporter